MASRRRTRQPPAPAGPSDSTMSAEGNGIEAAGAAGISSPTRWITLALVSGLFAALNGVFAKLTTTTQLHYSDSSPILSVMLRAVFFSLNIGSNAAMWFYFTKALTSTSSSTRVTILNTSANFIVTALLGLAIFRETLPLAWWFGAGLLVAGSVVIGSREGGEIAQRDEGSIRLGDDVPAAPGLANVELASRDAGTADVTSIAAGGAGTSETVVGTFKDDPDDVLEQREQKPL